MEDNRKYGYAGAMGSQRTLRSQRVVSMASTFRFALKVSLSIEKTSFIGLLRVAQNVVSESHSRAAKNENIQHPRTGPYEFPNVSTLMKSVCGAVVCW